MIALVVSLKIKPGTEAAFQEAVTRQGATSLDKEAGCRRFDVVKSTTDEHHYFLYEVYEDEAAFEAHRTTPHFQVWRAAAGEMVEEQVNTPASVISYTD